MELNLSFKCEECCEDIPEKDYLTLSKMVDYRLADRRYIIHKDCVGHHDTILAESGELVLVRES